MEAIFDDLTFPWVSSPLPHQLLQKMNILGIVIIRNGRQIFDVKMDEFVWLCREKVSANQSKMETHLGERERRRREGSKCKEPTLPLFHSVSNSKKMSLILSAVCEPLNFRMASVYFFLA
uniref:Uncharacterized protein n=1 Tax=Globodera rostochiensis TaxID=31243 RepID=A0A914H6L1_GLORO